MLNHTEADFNRQAHALSMCQDSLYARGILQIPLSFCGRTRSFVFVGHGNIQHRNSLNPDPIPPGCMEQFYGNLSRLYELFGIIRNTLGMLYIQNAYIRFIHVW